MKTGDILYWVPSEKYHMSEQDVVVGKVGRKWADISNSRYRINIVTLEADSGGYSSPGRCYTDKNAFLLLRETKNAWDSLRRSIGPLPDSVSLSAIIQAAELLRVKI